MGYKATTSRSRRAAKTKPKTSPRKAEAARRNGRRGGRPRKQRGFDDFATVADPPAHPVQLGHWMQRIVAIDAHRICESRENRALSREIRGYTLAMSKLLRPIILLAGAEPDGIWWRGPADTPPPADDPVATAHWLLYTLARSLHNCIHGRPHRGRELRATVSAYVKVIPPDTLYDARYKVTSWVKSLEQTPGPQPKPTEPPVHGLEERYRPIHC